jgi:hypothetical protein
MLPGGGLSLASATSSTAGDARGTQGNVGGLSSPIVFGGFKSNGEVGGGAFTPATLIKWAVGGAILFGVFYAAKKWMK